MRWMSMNAFTAVAVMKGMRPSHESLVTITRAAYQENAWVIECPITSQMGILIVMLVPMFFRVGIKHIMRKFQELVIMMVKLIKLMARLNWMKRIIGKITIISLLICLLLSSSSI